MFDDLGYIATALVELVQRVNAAGRGAQRETLLIQQADVGLSKRVLCLLAKVPLTMRDRQTIFGSPKPAIGPRKSPNYSL